MKTHLFRISLMLIALCFTQFVCADEVHVAVASNFAAPIKQLKEAFESSSDHKLKLSFGSSGKFHAQIIHGAPFGLMFSADQSVPQSLQQAGLVAPEGRATYAIGRLALWSAKNNIDVHKRLTSQTFQRLSLANPRHAPYGRAALEVLSFMGLESATKEKWVMGENIAQAYQFASTGNTDLGFVAIAQVTTGSSWLVPETHHSPIKQDVVLLKSAVGNRAARAFLDFVQQPRARKIIQSFGYSIPNSELPQI